MNNKKKLIFLITKSNWGGAQAYVYDLAVSKLRDEFEISVALGGNGALLERISEAGIRVHKLDRLGRDINILDEAIVLWQLIKLFVKERPDIVHVNSSKIGGLGAFAARCALVRKIVFTAHGWPFNEERPWPQPALIKFFSWLTVFFSTDTIVIGRAEQKQSAGWAFVKKKIHLIPISVENFNTLPKEIARTKIAETAKQPNAEIQNKMLIGCIAELHKNKGVEYLIRGFKMADAPNSILVIFGLGEEKDKLEQLIREEGLSNRVFLLGFLRNAKELFSAFDVFALTSVKEGLPYTILEAGLARLPVIATNVGAISEVIINGETGLLIAPKDVPQISTAIRRLITDHSLSTKIAHNLYKKVRTEYNLAQMIEKTKSVYNK